MAKHAAPAGAVEVGKRFLEGTVQYRGQDAEPLNFDTTAIGALTNVRVAPGQAACDMFVHKKVQNRYGTLHGGCIATLVDTVSTAALVTMSEKSGVSLNMNIDYIGPQPGGEVVEVSAKVVKLGKTIAVLSVELRQKSTGALVAQGKHTKFLAASEKPPPAEWLAKQSAPQSKL